MPCQRSWIIRVSSFKSVRELAKSMPLTMLPKYLPTVNEISSRIDDMEKSLGDLIENINSQAETKRS